MVVVVVVAVVVVVVIVAVIVIVVVVVVVIVVVVVVDVIVIVIEEDFAVSPRNVNYLNNSPLQTGGWSLHLPLSQVTADAPSLWYPPLQ